MHMIGQAIVGLIVGIIARFLLPGADGGGMIWTILIGVAGGFVGGQIGKWLGWYKDGHPAGWGLSIVGAMVLLLIVRMF
ncbi:MAG: GlsB/YeaQ/YmgE family stress response membrane protein [Acidobacteriota bacterium]